MHRLFVLTAVVLATAGCSTLPPPSPDYTSTPAVDQVTDPQLAEISGITPSRLTPDRFWVHNDSGDRARIFALDAHGALLGTVEFPGVKARDWEDIASFTLDGQAWLLIADVGDNHAVRDDLKLHFVREPDPADLSPDRPLRLHPDLTWNIAFIDGARDCEGVTVSPRTREVLLLSKRTEPPVLYRLPLDLNASVGAEVQIAQRVTPLPGIVPPTTLESALGGRYGPFRSQVTAFDLSDDGTLAAVLTYSNIWLYSIHGDEPWTTVFNRSPARIPVRDLAQAEALCFIPDSHDFIVTTEKLPAPLQRYPGK